ncbi:isochorismatase family protein [Exophiala viscosa]|uniref:Isochorismatase family protein n=1 Tax=Exophiala viscosa TaxID=2486360 RepID=A0AAN6DUW1_9EURO|nr:isochorismatase family protein [Exophiala viscosa]KAI1626179.1 isochorismatase family protein [Exophiala viscosa]
MGTTVLLVLDVQNGVVDLAGSILPDNYLDRLAHTINAARQADLRVIYVSVAFRPGYPEKSDRNSSTSRVKARGDFIEGSESTQIHPAVAMCEGDIHITKRRVSAFHGTELDLVLRSLDAETLVITGLVSSGAVLSTVRQAADLDYRQIVLEDLCADSFPEVHEILVKKVFSKQARVMSSAEWVAEIEKK